VDTAGAALAGNQLCSAASVDLAELTAEAATLGAEIGAEAGASTLGAVGFVGFLGGPEIGLPATIGGVYLGGAVGGGVAALGAYLTSKVVNNLCAVGLGLGEYNLVQSLFVYDYEYNHDDLADQHDELANHHDYLANHHDHPANHHDYIANQHDHPANHHDHHRNDHDYHAD
jgi:hypothetical protein